MYAHKNVMKVSFAIMLLCGIVALVLEVYCKNMNFEHKDFTINLMLGIFASSLVTLLTSYLSYNVIWIDSLSDYTLVADELFFENAFFHRYLTSIMDNGEISLEKCVSDELLNKIQNIQLELTKLHVTARQISIIKIPLIKGKRRKMFNEIIKHYRITSEYSIVISNVEKYIMYVRVNKKKGWEEVIYDFYNQFQKMIDYLDEGDNTLYSAHNDLQQEFLSYYNI